MNNKSKNTMYAVWSVAIVLCVLLVFFALLFSSISSARKEGPATLESSMPAISSSTPGANATADPDATVDPNATPAPPSTQLAETEDAGQEYIDKLIFLGDSTTYGLKKYGNLTDGENTKQVWTPADGTLSLFNQSTATIVYPETGEEMLIKDAVALAKPEYMVITLGVNGVAMMNEEYFTSEYTKLVMSIQEASPDTKIICNSIYPVMSTYKYIGSINNTNIPQANEWILAVAEDTGTRYADSASVLKGDDSSLPAEYCIGDGVEDGIHLNTAGFTLVLQYLRTHAYF